MLDEVEDDHSARQADYVLADRARHHELVREPQSTTSNPPLVKGLGRSNPKERARSRKLDDDELRAVWKAAEKRRRLRGARPPAALTGQRRDKVASMRWQDVAEDGTWTILSEAREKGNAGELKLPEAALAIVRAQPMLGDSPFVFAGRSGNGKDVCMSGWSKRKRALDAEVALALPDVPQWQLHDLRRTARSLMSRAGVPSEHAERVMGHAIAGVEGVYDVHEYRDEKAMALAKLATSSIVSSTRATRSSRCASRRGSADEGAALKAGRPTLSGVERPFPEPRR